MLFLIRRFCYWKWSSFIHSYSLLLSTIFSTEVRYWDLSPFFYRENSNEGGDSSVYKREGASSYDE